MGDEAERSYVGDLLPITGPGAPPQSPVTHLMGEFRQYDNLSLQLIVTAIMAIMDERTVSIVTPT